MIWGAEQLFITRPYDGNKVGSLSQSRCAPLAFAEHQNIINKILLHWTFISFAQKCSRHNRPELLPNLLPKINFLSIWESNYPKLLLYCTITHEYCGNGKHIQLVTAVWNSVNLRIYYRGKQLPQAFRKHFDQLEELLKAALELDLLIEMSIPGENKGFGENV